MINEHKNIAKCRVTNMEPIILDIVYIVRKKMYAKLANIQARLFNRYLGLFLGPNTIHLAIHSKITKMPPIITIDNRRLSLYDIKPVLYLVRAIHDRIVSTSTVIKIIYPITS